MLLPCDGVSELEMSLLSACHFVALEHIIYYNLCINVIQHERRLKSMATNQRKSCPSKEHDGSSIVTLRLPDDLLERLDRYLDRIGKFIFRPSEIPITTG